jgi:hypothetical protein
MFVRFQLANKKKQEINLNILNSFQNQLPSNDIKNYIKFLNTKINEDFDKLR